MVLVLKKDQSWHFCVDYRKLNVITLQGEYPLPWIDKSLDALDGRRYFSTLNLTSGYWQVSFDSDAQEKSTFVTHSGFGNGRCYPSG